MLAGPPITAVDSIVGGFNPGSAAWFSASFDQPIRPRQHLRRNRHADPLGRLEIDDELELRRRVQLLSKNSVPLGNL